MIITFLIIYVLVVFAGAVGCKCGLEEWFDKTVKVDGMSLLEPGCLPIVIVLWPISIFIGFCGFVGGYLWIAFDRTTTFIADMVCPNRRR